MTMKSNPLNVLTLETLKTHPGFAATLWRTLLESSRPMAMRDVTKQMRVPIQNSSVSRLLYQGWIKRVGGKGTITKPFLYVAVVDGVSRERSKPGEHFQKIRRRLTVVAKKAHKARYTALPNPMAKALREIEKELLEIREQVYLKKANS